MGFWDDGASPGSLGGTAQTSAGYGGTSRAGGRLGDPLRAMGRHNELGLVGVFGEGGGFSGGFSDGMRLGKCRWFLFQKTFWC